MLPPRRTIQPLIRLALREDRTSHDVTSRAVIPSTMRIRARIVVKSAGILAGGQIAIWTFQAVDPSLRCTLTRRDGAALARGRTILTVEGRARSIFAAERTVLNLLGHLSGIATLTHTYVWRAAGTRAVIYDTRKTLPGLRALEKCAVLAGGGKNHRRDLAEAVLIKTNHLQALGRGARGEGRGKTENIIQKAIFQAKQRQPRKFVEVEVRNLSEFKAALEAHPDAILLDNWRTTAQIRQAVLLRPPAPRAPCPVPLLEVSGGVTLANVRAIARTGVERISIGRLTHSAPSLDVSLEVLAGRAGRSREGGRRRDPEGATRGRPASRW